MNDQNSRIYYVPAPSKWPIVGSIGLLIMVIGGVSWIHKQSYGPWVFFAGSLIFIYMLFGWFGAVVHESRAGLLDDPQVTRSYKWGMAWFIFTEIALFMGLFFVLFYARIFAVPWLGGAGTGQMTHLLLWPEFTGSWPVLHPPNPALFTSITEPMEAWGIPAINTLIILCSGAAITFGYWGVIKNRRWQMAVGVALTALLGIAFLIMQVNEYWIAYTVRGVKLTAGIYGSTFFMLTGFDALHVFAGVIMLTVIFWRILKGDFTTKNHFAFSAVFWYWHLVEVIWLALFVFVYWI